MNSSPEERDCDFNTSYEGSTTGGWAILILIILGVAGSGIYLMGGFGSKTVVADNPSVISSPATKK